MTERSRCDSVRSGASEGYLKRNSSEGVSNIMSGKAPEYKRVAHYRQTLSGALHMAKTADKKLPTQTFNAYCTINMSNLKSADIKKPKSSVMRGKSLLGAFTNQ